MVKLIRHPDDATYWLKVIMEHVPDDTVPCGCRHILHCASPWYGSSGDAAQFFFYSAAEVRLAARMLAQLPWTLMYQCQYCYGHSSGIAIPRYDIRPVAPDWRLVPVEIGEEWH